jgi:hypothetical protein
MASEPSLFWPFLTTLTGSLLAAGCAYFVSWHDLSKSWVGHPIARFVSVNGEPSSITPLADGDEEYRFDLRKLDPSCVHWWKVDKEGTIVGYRFQGRCRPVG